jgi:hypothetical protein
MKQLFKNKFVEITLVKGFVVGIGFNDSNTNFILFIGCITFEFTLPKKEVKSPYEIEL